LLQTPPVVVADVDVADPEPSRIPGHGVVGREPYPVAVQERPAGRRHPDQVEQRLDLPLRIGDQVLVPQAAVALLVLPGHESGQPVPDQPVDRALGRRVLGHGFALVGMDGPARPRLHVRPVGQEGRLRRELRGVHDQ
jgi:hypothetical protein